MEPPGQLYFWQLGDEGKFALVCLVDCDLLRWYRYPGLALYQYQILDASVLGSCLQCGLEQQLTFC